MNRTKAQREAIDTKEKNVLISAAAGSGKTSVLTERIVSLINGGDDIRRMLVVTFTKKAAKEMKKRIRAGLMEAASDGNDPRLAIQAEETDSADISTIHTFATKIVKENFSELNLHARVHAAGEEQIKLFKAEAFEELLQEDYEEQDESLLRLRDSYSGRTDDDLINILKDIYSFCMSRPEGIGWLDSKGRPVISAYRETAFSFIRQDLKEMLRLSDKCMDLLDHGLISEKQEQRDRGDNAELKDFSVLLETDPDRFRETVNGFNVSKTISDKDDDPNALGLLRNYKDGMRAKLKDIKKVLLTLEDGVLEREKEKTETVIDDLYHVLTRYEKIYSEIKKEHDVIDFDDMLRLAYQALRMRGAAEKYSARYDYIFIDEYQDTNPLQEDFLNLIEPGKGRFMVGDMKQSIYRFRATDPMIFKNKTFNVKDNKVIKMNDNFRCVPEIIDTVNNTMDFLMCDALGELEYSDEEKLVARVEKHGEVRVILTETGKENAEIQTEMEAVTIAGLIKDILKEKDEKGNRRYSNGDICILTRSVETHGDIMLRALRNEGLNVSLNRNSDMDSLGFDLFLNLLHVVENFSSDIALLSVLRSFFGDFSDAELGRIKAEEGCDTFHESLMKYSMKENGLAQKCRDFLNRLNRYRVWASVMSLEDLILRIKNEENVEAYLRVMKRGEAYSSYFETYFYKLLEWARERTGLYDLLTFVDSVRKEQVKNDEEVSTDSIQLMTMHSAKGLEFPIVILARLQGEFSKRDSRDSIFCHGTLGVSIRNVDIDRRTRSKTELRNIAEKQAKMEQKSEELRLLYVAMTRAKERLYISGAVQDAEKYLKDINHKVGSDPLEDTNVFDWVMKSFWELECFSDWFPLRQGKNKDLKIYHEIVKGTLGGNEVRSGGSFDKRRLLEGITDTRPVEFREYGNRGIPQKIGVSSLLPKDDEGIYIPAMSMEEDRGAELGTLIHLFMQHMDFSINTWEGLEALSVRLMEDMIISENEAERLRGFYPQILSFLTSEMAERIRKADRVLREVPFSLLERGKDIGLGDNDEKVVVQGIIDLAFLEGDEYVILDYKSNMVSEDRMAELADHYKIQMKMYTRALEKISGKKVKNSYLWFVRREKEFLVF